MIKQRNGNTDNIFLRVFGRGKYLFFGSRKKTIATIIGLLIICFFGWKIFGQATAQVKYQTSQVTKGSIISSVTESGNITTNTQGGVGSPTTGIIQEVYVKNGDTVTAGQNLFKVKSTASAQEIASAYAAYQNALSQENSAQQGQMSAQAMLEKDRASIIAASTAVTNMQNNIASSQPNPATKQPYTQNDIDGINSALTSAQETFNADQAKYNSSGQSISAAQASANSAWLAYEATQDSVITAPINGTVANLSVQPGDEVTASSGNLSSELSSSSNSSSGSTILSIGDFSQPYIKIQASEVDIPNIKEGEKATITLNAYPNKTFVGEVSQVDTIGTVSSGVVTYNVYIKFIAAPIGIEPGMSATVTIQTARKDDVLTVPSSAIQNVGGQTMARVLQNGKMALVAVTTGITSDTDTEITSGLSEGETVVTNIIQPTTTSGASSSPFGSTNRGFGGGGFGGGGRTVIRSGGQ